MEFEEFAAAAADAEAADADTAVVERVAALFGGADVDLAVVARFVQGRVFPAWSERTLDVGPSLCYAALAEAATGEVSAADVEDRLASAGDVGDVAAAYDLGSQRGLGAFAGGDAARSVGDVFDDLDALAAASGSGSEAEKRRVLARLFSESPPEEARYLARLVLGEMRIGVGEGTVRDATAEAFDVSTEAVERALQVSNDYGRVAAVARDEGEAGLADLRLEVGRPVQAMLAQTGGATDALDAWERVAVEWKFDGARVQLHHGDETRVFSRNMAEVTSALPEVVEFADQHLDTPAILDGEVVAVDEDGDPLPFQEVLRRFRRKHDVNRLREEVRVEVHAFDCLHVDGDDLLDAPLTERHDRLAALLDGAGVSDLVLVDDAEAVAAEEAAALEAGHEGIMLKDPDSAYTPGRRGQKWLKRKPDVETLDLAVVGAEWGEGRRANVLGTFELGARTDGGFERVGNVATGLTDEELDSLTERLEPHVRAEAGQHVDLEPVVVVEVGYEEIQSSTNYESGYALRFPRFRAVREDVDARDADAVERVARLADEG